MGMALIWNLFPYSYNLGLEIKRKRISKVKTKIHKRRNGVDTNRTAWPVAQKGKVSRHSDTRQSISNPEHHNGRINVLKQLCSAGFFQLSFPSSK